jgi:hypothetical protein
MWISIDNGDTNPSLENINVPCILCWRNMDWLHEPVSEKAGFSMQIRKPWGGFYTDHSLLGMTKRRIYG